MLTDLQQRFIDGIFDGDTAVVADLLPSASLSAAERLAIYRDSMRGIHAKALGLMYPVCKRLVGESFFNPLCLAYLGRHPGDSHSLDDFGRAFAGFLEEFEPARQLPYLADVVRLEWAWHQAFNAAEETFDVAALGELAETDLARVVFRPSPSLRLLDSTYPVHRIWEANQPDAGESEVHLDEGPVRLAIWRRGDAMHMAPADASQWRLLQYLQQRASMDALLGIFPADDLAGLLELAMHRGWLGGFSLT